MRDGGINAMTTKRQIDHAGRAQAMELIIQTLMRIYCRDPDHPMLEEMRPVFAEVGAIHAALRHLTQSRA